MKALPALVLAGLSATLAASAQGQAVPAVAAINSPFRIAGELTQGGWMRGQVPAGASTAVLGDVPLRIAPDGSFFAAFDRDEGPLLRLSATMRDGAVLDMPLVIAPRAWAIEHINVARRPGGVTDEAYQARRAGELERISAARALDNDSAGWRQGFIWPARGRISGRFGSQRVYRGEPAAYHSGLDIAGGAGTAFVAPADGVVVLAASDPFSLEGHLIIIDHGQGLNSAFLHSSEILVHNGQVVKQGDVLGRIGATGRASGPHLHWSIKWRDARLDPLLFLPPQV